jgi:hypothetical protein
MDFVCPYVLRAASNTKKARVRLIMTLRFLPNWI